MARAFSRSMSNSWPVQNNDSKTWTDELLDTLQVVQVGVACTRSSQRRQRTSGEQLWKTTGGRLCQMPRSDLSCSSAFFGPPQSDYNMHLYSGILGVTFDSRNLKSIFSLDYFIVNGLVCHSSVLRFGTTFSSRAFSAPPVRHSHTIPCASDDRATAAWISHIHSK